MCALYSIKGIIYDKQRGNLLKVNADGEVVMYAFLLVINLRNFVALFLGYI